MNITTQKPERNEALAAIRQAVIAGVHEWPADTDHAPLARQLAAHLHITLTTSDLVEVIKAYEDYTGRLDWNNEEILDYLDETRWHPALDDFAWEKTLELLTEKTNNIVLALNYDILDAQETSDLFNGDSLTDIKGIAA